MSLWSLSFSLRWAFFPNSLPRWLTHACLRALYLTRKQSRAVLLFSATLPLIIRHPAHTYFFLQSRYITHPVLSKRALDYSGNRGAGTRYIQKHIYSVYNKSLFSRAASHSPKSSRVIRGNNRLELTKCAARVYPQKQKM